MDWDQYPDDAHEHPMDPTAVEIVAYRRKDRGYDVYVLEPRGSLPPSLEDGWVDDDYVFIATIQSSYELNAVAADIDTRLGADYHAVPYYREAGSRRMIGKITSHLAQRGARHMFVHSTNGSDWELLIRRKDIQLAREIISSNV